MRRLLVMVVAVALGGVTLVALPTVGERVTVEDCADEFGAGLASKLPPELGSAKLRSRFYAASYGICAELLELGDVRAMDEQEATAAVGTVFTERPDLYEPLCTAVAEAEFAAYEEPLRFVTKPERKRYVREHCGYAIRYLDTATMQIDYARLAAEHPQTYAPLCASLIQNDAYLGGATALAGFSREQFQRITRRTCVQALASGAITCGPNGLTDATVDEERFEAILDRSVEEGRDA